MVYIWPPIHGCGRDGYIHMREEVRYGQVGRTSPGVSAPAARPKTPTSGLMREKDILKRRAQLDTANRLSSPSPRQLRIASETSSRGDCHVLKQLRMAMPYSPGVTLSEREKAIKYMHQTHFSSSGSPVPRTPVSPMLLKTLKSPGRPRSGYE